MSYWGFDDRPHTGTMIVNAKVVEPVLSVFGSLYAQRFPIRRMEPVDAFGGSDPASMAADNTSAFNCRDAVAPGPPRWSVHAYGEAIDVNTVENPYVEGGKVQPAAGSAFLDRADAPAGHGVPRWCARLGVRRGRMALGWSLVGSRLPALLRDGRLTARRADTVR